MRNENFITLNGWMVNVLNLKGNELLVYALIYGFTQDGENEFTGSLSYISEWLNCSKPTTIKALDGLIAKKYISKETVEVSGVKFNRYKAILPVVKKLYWGSKETLLGGSKETLLGGSKETLPNNIYNNNIDNIYNDINSKPLPKVEKHHKKVYGEYHHVKLSDDDISKLKEITDDVNGWIVKLDEYIENSGKKYKNHYLTIRNWINREKPKQKELPEWYGNIPTEKADDSTLKKALEMQKRLKQNSGLPDWWNEEHETTPPSQELLDSITEKENRLKEGIKNE